jgi:hypothetical protein
LAAGAQHAPAACAASAVPQHAVCAGSATVGVAVLQQPPPAAAGRAWVWSLVSPLDVVSVFMVILDSNRLIRQISKQLVGASLHSD